MTDREIAEHPVVALAARLVRTRTVNPPGDEGPLAAALARELAADGFETTLVEHGGGRASLIATAGPADDREPLILSGHLDTVPIGEAPWADDPFGATIRDGRLIGRGSTDMKGGVAAILVAARRLVASRSLRGRLVLALTADEEVGTTGARGIGAHPGFPRSGNLVIGEPTGLRPGIAEKGALWVEVVFTGKAAHGAYAHEGASATMGLIAAMPGVAEVVRPLPPHPILGPTTANVAMIGGGSAPNMVADRAWARVDVRSAPGVEHGAVIAAMRAALAAAPMPAGVRAEVVTIADRRSFETPASHPLVAAAGRALAAAGVAERDPIGLAYYTDAAELVAAGPYTPLILGPGDPGMAHQVDESVSIDALIRCADAYEAIGRELLG